MCSCSHCQCVTGTPQHQQCRVCRIDNIASLLIASFVDGAVSFTVQARRVWFIQKRSMVQFCNLLKDQYRNRAFIEQKIAELEIDPPKTYVWTQEVLMCLYNHHVSSKTFSHHHTSHSNTICDKNGRRYNGFGSLTHSKFIVATIWPHSIREKSLSFRKHQKFYESAQ